MEFHVYRDDIKDIGLYKHVNLSSDAEMDDYIYEERKKNKLDKEEEESHDMTPIDELLNKELESISLGQNSLKDIKFLLPFKNLKCIDVRGNFLKQDLFQDLLEFPLLEELDISRNFWGHVDIKDLTKFKLKSLNINFVEIGDEGFEHICKISTLETLLCIGTKITRKSLFMLNKLPNLKLLDLSYNDFCQDNRKPLPSPIVKFGYLCITYSNISEEDIIVLKSYADECCEEGNFDKE